MIRHSRKMFLLAALCTLALSGCYHNYSADAITATVVDADTKQPLEGTIVDALWELQGGLEGGNVEGNVMVIEATTDASGTFHFPAWGPKKVPIGPLSNTRLKNLDPWMILFKSGYEFKKVANDRTMEQMRGDATHRTSDWNGKTIEMKRFLGAPKEYASHIHDWFPSYAFAGRCEWRNIPMMILAIGDQSRISEKQLGYGSGNFYWDLENNDGFGCGPFEQFLREHKK